MTHRLLLTSFLLLLAANANAAIDRVHSASGESGAPCPSATLTESVDVAPGKTDIVSPVPSTASPTGASPATTPSSRPSLRWHSFLPGMMK